MWPCVSGASSAARRKGQALAETALFTLPLVALAVALVLLVLSHRAMAVADAAATACAAVLAAETGPATERAATMARATVEGAWSGLARAGFTVSLLDGEPGAPVFCQVTVTLPLPMGRLMGQETLTYTGAASALKELRRASW